MISLPPVAAVIFDFDGVLADTEDLHCAAFQQVARERGLALSRDDYYLRFLGLPDHDCIAAFCAGAGQTLPPADVDRLVARKRRHYAELSRTTGLYPGVAPTLRQLSEHFALAIASGAARDEIQAVLRRAGVQSLFGTVVAAEDVTAGKPAPDPFLRALDGLNRPGARPVAARECVVVEDSPAGVTAARAAGMRCIAVTTSHDGAAFTDADAVIDGVASLRLEDFGR
jgi:HAD superfamily hydrolase (TIGR01509 family)